MSNTAATVTRSQIAAALSNARARVAADRRWLTALNKAAMELEAAKWAWFAAAGVLKIESRTVPGKFYTVTAQGCTCQAASAGRACWHAAAHRLIVRASEQPAAIAPAARRRDSQAEADAMFH